MAGIGVMADDARWMRRAIALAPRGIGHVNPNPLVGAVIVRDGRLLGEGAHERFGSLHAERNALADCARRGNDPAGATAYVTLEPCSHTGHQPPCVDALIDARIARVVVGWRAFAPRGSTSMRTCCARNATRSTLSSSTT